MKNGYNIGFICFLIFFYTRLPLISAHSEFDHDHVAEEFIGEGDTIEIIFGKHLHYKYTFDGRMMINDCEVIGKLGHGLAGDFKRWVDMDLPRRRLNPYYAFGSWPNGDVCYEIDTASFIADPWDTLLWNEVVNEYSTKTGINLIEKGTISPCINPNYWIRIHEGIGCWSYVGQVSNIWSAIWVNGTYVGQPLSLGYDCQYLTTIVHEIGHAIGMQHTQTRSDRDDWVTIHWDNIKEEKKSNFEISANPIGFCYDCTSVMHYSEYSFCIDVNKPTITVKDATQCTITRNPTSPLSVNDVDVIELMYPTNTPTINPIDCPTVSPTTVTIGPTISPITSSPTTTVPTVNTPTNTPTTAFPTASKSPTTDTAYPSTSPTFAPLMSPSMAPLLPPSLSPTFSPSFSPSISPSILPTLSPSITPTSMPTPKCHCAKFKGEMIVSSNMNRNDILWGGESFVSDNCKYLLTLQHNGNIILKYLVNEFINPFEKDENGNYIGNINDGCRQQINRNGWQIVWNINILIANHSGESVPKLILQDGSLVVYEEQFKNVSGIEAILLWRSNDASNIGNDVILRLTDEACLMLHKYGENDDIETAIWYKCFVMDNDNTNTYTTSFITSFYDFEADDDDIFDGNTNGNILDSSWWIWLLIILIFLFLFITFICFIRYLHNKKLISNTSNKTIDKMDGEFETYEVYK